MRRRLVLTTCALFVLLGLGTAPVSATNGSLRVLVIKATWGPQPLSDEAAAQLVFGDTAGFLRRSSFGQLLLIGDATPWLSVWQAAPTCNNLGDLLPAPTSAAQAAGYDRVVLGRSLRSVESCVRIANPADAAGLLPAELPELFDSGELAEAAGMQRRLAQQMSYCLRAMGVLEPVGKRGRAVVHRRVEAPGALSAE
jgi:hypothetical protein